MTISKINNGKLSLNDVVWVMNKFYFDNYMDPLILYIKRYIYIEGDHRVLIKEENHSKKDASFHTLSIEFIMDHHLDNIVQLSSIAHLV